MKKVKVTEHYGCTWCMEAGQKVAACFRKSGLGGLSKAACENHTENLREYEKKMRKHDSHMSEADYQTWGRF
jgi:hypothetical protein